MISSPDSPSSSQVNSENSSAKEEKEKSPLMKEFEEKLNALSTPEERVAHGLLFMRSSISQEGSPHFREFWEARRAVLSLFKENLNPAIRSKLWDEFVELTVEARRLKEIFEEQSAFAIEQIDLAIGAIEEDVANFQKLLEAQGTDVISNGSDTIRKKEDFYQKLQSELNLLNTLAGRLNSLRKEIGKTDMRIRFKTKFYKRLSELGDQIFPKRKALIEEVSQAFEKDVDQFVQAHFQDGAVIGAPYYALREEIKALQGMAKVFTLNSAAFTKTRLQLSECWDKVKVLEKEHKKEIFEKRQASSVERQALQSSIDELSTKATELSLDALNREIDAILQQMRSISLTRDDVHFLKSALHALKKPHLEAQEQKQKEMEKIAEEKLKKKREEIALLKEKIASLTEESDSMEVGSLTDAFEELKASIGALKLSKMEKQLFDRSLRPLKDLILEKKEQSLLNLSEDDKKNLENLKMVLEQKKARRQEIKDQLEVCRKALGGSNLDFEKAMQYQEMLEQEKVRLEKANEGIEEIERKIEELEA